LPYVLNVLSETVTLTALDYPDFFRESVQLARNERDRLIRELGQLPGIHPYPSAANFILCRLDMGSSDVFQHLVADGILIRDVSSYPGLKDHLRISVGMPKENDAVLASLSKFVGAAP
jgi:histidinol-phosphate aminotransferase